MAGDVGDEVEVLVEVEDGEVVQLRGCGDDEVGDGGCPVLASVGEEHLDRHGAVYDGGSEVLDREEGKRRSGEVAAEFGRGPGGVADLEASNGTDPR